MEETTKEELDSIQTRYSGYAAIEDVPDYKDNLYFRKEEINYFFFFCVIKFN